MTSDHSSDGPSTADRSPVIRHDWSHDELRAVHDLPFPELVYWAQRVHRAGHDPATVERATLLSIKTGGCPEDCAYCPQSAHYDTGVERSALMDVEATLAAAREAAASGSTRFCMGAAWRSAPHGHQFDRVLDMVSAVAALGLEVCCTLGMLTDQQARRLAEAGLAFYNHNLDTSPAHYGEIVTTRTYQDRLRTLTAVRHAGIAICSGGIVGMGESIDDRVGMIAVLAGLDPHPESVPINALVPVPGTPLEDCPPVPAIEVARVIATTRIAMPRAIVRLSAGRTQMSSEAQALCILAGANSIFAGERLLTTPNPTDDSDAELFASLGMRSRSAPASR